MFEFYLKDLFAGASLEISFKFNGKEFAFPVKIKKVTKETTYTEVIKLKEQVLPLDKFDFPINLTYFRINNKPVIWEDCKVSVTKDNSGEYFFAFPNDINGKVLNRRKNFRIDIDLEADVLLNNKVKFKGTVKDLSSSGFSILIDNHVTLNEKEAITIVFTDTKLNKHLKLSGKIVRVVSVDKENLYGCIISFYNSNLDHYLNLKQRELLIKHAQANNRLTL